ncbi:MAG: sigma 54-interacting transcriptional regulator [Candidatus Tectomicrobia bacterium]|nr:sigma 54-interacting transcriptional regulator [Candidatus Tectomicrobia bacterium]
MNLVTASPGTSSPSSDALTLDAKVKRYEAREAILSRISNEIYSVINLDVFLQATVNELGKMMQVDRCDLMALGYHQDLRINYEYRSDDHLPRSQNLALPLQPEFFLENRERMAAPIAIDDTTAPWLHELVRQVSRELQTKSVLIVPIAFQDQLLGVIGLHHCVQQHHWTQDEITFMTSLAQQFAVAFQYSRLYTEKEQDVQIARTLLEISNEIHTKFDTQETAAFVLEKSLELFRADFGCLGDLDRRNGSITFGTIRPAEAASHFLLQNPLRLPPEVEPLLRQPNDGALCLERHSDDPVAHYLMGRVFRCEAALLTPIVVGGQLLGVMALLWRRARKPFTDYERQLVDGIASQAALVFERDQLSSEVVQLRRQLTGVRAAEQIIGHSPSIQACIEAALHVAASTTTVLLQGESGTGKELLADLIQRSGPRQNRPFIKINCGAIPETLLESELFGHEGGAFTDAKQRRIGTFEEADGGAIFLDEVGELSANAQVKLLRVLQDGRFARIGSNTVRSVDVRVIAATNVDLEAAVERGAFRRDLYYRLNVYPLKVPPLRERQGDMPLLAHHFLEVFKRKTGRNVSGFSEQAMRLLEGYTWPGNVRELQNVVERAVILARRRTITPDELGEQVCRQSHNLPRVIQIELASTLEDAERTLLLETLRFAGGNIKRTAEMLGIGRMTLYRKLKRYGVERD